MISSFLLTRKAWSFPGLLVLALVIGFPVQAQSVSELQNRIKRLENDIQTLNRAVYRGEKPPAPAGGFGGAGVPSADAEIRMQQMESEIRQMRGKMEELSFENRQLRQELERATGDLKLQMQDMKGGGSASPGPVSSGAAPTTSSAASQDGYQWSSNNVNEKPSGGSQLGQLSQSPSGAANPSVDSAASAYDDAYASIRNKQYARAQTQFESFLSSYPNHALAGNAKYWLGESHYVRGQYDDAARIFAEGYQQYPKGSKVADNLLKLGMSLGALGKTEDACIALGQLKKENIPGAAPVMRRAENEQARLGCS